MNDVPKYPFGSNGKPAVIPIRSVDNCPCDEHKAATAYRRYATLRRAERDDPTLADDECFHILISDAYRSFETAFNKIGGIYE